MNQLTSLSHYTQVVADTGEFSLIAQYRPVDATTNPSLILKAVQKTDYQDWVASVVKKAKAENPNVTPSETIDRLLVAFGVEILKFIPGRVSTEVDAKLSFDTPATIAKGIELIHLYEQAGIPKNRVLIKIAATWEGIAAAKALQAEGVACNMTLIFSLVQAVACARAGATLISPFVGRIYDWAKKNAGANWDETKEGGANDPGVKSVREIFHYFKHYNYATQVMGASFRNTSQILELAGCDLLTISPDLLGELKKNESAVLPKLSAKDSQAMTIAKIDTAEPAFRLQMNDSAMATEKLAEGIRLFCADTVKLENMLAQY